MSSPRKKKTPAADPIHQNPASAWKHLCESGGIEISVLDADGVSVPGRDEGLDQEILQRLDPKSPSLDAALANASMPKFVRAFFASVHPYLSMARDILDFFRQSDATKGQAQWRLQLDDIDMNLEQFREHIENWEKAGRVTQTVRAVDFHGMWKICSILGEIAPKSAGSPFEQDKKPGPFPDDVQAWIEAYNLSKTYRNFPESLQAPTLAVEFRDVALIAEAVLDVILGFSPSREALMDVYQQRDGKRQNRDKADAYNFWSVTQEETDHWLRSMIWGLAATTLQTPAEKAKTGSRLKELLDKYPMKPRTFDASLADLQSVLSLPIWHKRHELYSVWIATEIVRALAGHRVEIHHDHGRIAFAFRETPIATVHSSVETYQLISEKRVPFTCSKSKSRVSGAQPDHGLWAGAPKTAQCRLVVEVKHYKKSGGGKFIEVLDDYARAFRDAHVYLVSHGPIGSIVYDLPADVQPRCHTIERFVTTHLEARAKLAKAVRDCVGEPVSQPPSPESVASGEWILVLDVSSSMKALLQEPASIRLIENLVATYRPQLIASIDTVLAGTWPADASGIRMAVQAGGGATELGPALSQLSQPAKTALILTDADGVATLPGPVRFLPNDQTVSADIRQCIVTLGERS